MADIIGTDEPDVLQGTPSFDRIEGRKGNDLLLGGNGSDLLDGEEGDDVIYGGGGGDRLEGGDGHDVIYGRGGRDALLGEMGDDRLFGGAGSDVINGGAGVDMLSGGSGDDAFHFFLGQMTFTPDVITDFAPGDYLRFEDFRGPHEGLAAFQQGDDVLVLRIRVNPDRRPDDPLYEKLGAVVLVLHASQEDVMNAALFHEWFTF